MPIPVLAFVAGTGFFTDPSVLFAGIVVLAVGLNWLAVRTGVPSILAYLLTGFLLGPVLGVLNPDELLGDLLLPLVSLAVGIILFEGGLSLRFREIRGHARVIWLLVTVGVLVTWGVGWGAALIFTDLSTGLALLLGAILVVSGPTVIGPLLSHVRPDRPVGPILKWESILVDPIGVLLAVITFDVLLIGEGTSALSIAGQVGMFLLAGVGVGAVLGAGLIVALRRRWVPAQLLSLVGLGPALIAFVVANSLVVEAGLLATPTLGMVLANHKRVSTEQILHFSETIRVLLIGVLFIVLSARIGGDQLSLIGVGAVGILIALVIVARPMAAMLATIGTTLSWRHRILIATVAPRGIVAASIASVFALGLEAEGVPGADKLTPLVLAVIVGTVVIYGLGMAPVARALGLARRRQEGVLIIGAGRVERSIATALQNHDIPVLLATINRRDDYRARMEGLETHYGNVLVEDIDLDLDLSGIGRVLALTPNDDVNTLAVTRFAGILGRAETYQLVPGRAPAGIDSSAASNLAGRILFDGEVGHEQLAKLLRAGATVRSSPITAEFTVRDFQAVHPVPLFVIKPNRRLIVITSGDGDPFRNIGEGDTVLSLMESDAPGRSAVASGTLAP
ncbi:MAG: cation:proton antiporter [Acidimicrobiia bacterium]